ncbi:Isoniazid-inducible protein iniA [Aeromicrobium sp. A1-2]|uniref:dynamin family protein n=1 Tax=Aeromicrobium sp. A1-2 TaxID=2107713 RepID=UPI000E4D9DF0|nr:dynamin family protein [Aeromicrobium sp. A1-2]AXT86573.1 Isoniazid-inducible protein iniA [Aeromicrobium sp. A1-2]
MSNLSGAPSRTAEMTSLLARTAEIASQANRNDLVARIDALMARVQDPTMRVVVVGQFKQGKSALVNALINASVCPVDDVVGTAVPTIVSYGATASATLFTEIDGIEGVQAKDIPVTRLKEHVTEAATEREGVRPVRVEVAVPSPALAGGLVLVDTPGVGGTSQAHSASTLTMLPGADAVLMLSDASQEYTDPELAFLKQSISLCPTVTCVLSKIDPHPHWRQIAEADRRHLSKAGLDLSLLPVSAAMHARAVHMNDAVMDAESGVPQLLDLLNTQVVDRVIDQTSIAVGQQVLSVVDHLSLALESELQVLRNPSEGDGVVRSLRGAQASAKALSEKSATWQQTLNDGIQDLTADIEFDLRDRLRNVGREGELLIDDCDPGDAWEEVGAWLADSIAQAVGDNFVWAHQRSEWLSGAVAEHFAIEGAVDLPQFRLSDTDGVLNPIAGLERIETGALSVPQKFLIGMRNSYGGVLMFGLLTSLAGLALINPISIAAGMVIGGYAYRQEAVQRLERRRNVAKVAVRRLIDEAVFQVGKESRDRLNHTRRLLRDHFTVVAENLRRSLNVAIASAQAGADADPDGGIRRITELEVWETALRDLVTRVKALEPVAPLAETAAS